MTEDEEDGRVKAWEALREKAVGVAYLDTPEGRAALCQLLTLPLVPKWGKAPESARCSKCGAGEQERSFIMVGGPYSGMVRCPACGHQESVMSQIARNLVKVTPLPPLIEAPQNRKARRAKKAKGR